MGTRRWGMLLLGLAGCVLQGPETPSVDAGTSPGGGAPGPSLQVGEPEPVLPLDHPPVVDPNAGVPSGGVRRLSLAQLKGSLPVVLRGHTWKIGTANGFDSRSATLGVPDYVGSVEENLEPTPLYAKFMGDMARDACNRALTADAAEVDASKRAVMRFVAPTDTLAGAPDKVDANLRYLRLAFLGAHAPAGDAPELARLRKLFGDAVLAASGGAVPTKAHVTEGWRTVCVALLTSPEFHLY
jgi:hypothetical protein